MDEEDEAQTQAAAEAKEMMMKCQWPKGIRGLWLVAEKTKTQLGNYC